jgi:predicted nucleic acid-binding protein
MGNSLFTEYESLTNRDEIIKKSTLTITEIEILLACFMSVCRWTSIYYLWRSNLKDEADNQLIELALAGNAQLVVTNNIKDFRGAELLFPQLQIIQPEHFLEV